LARVALVMRSAAGVLLGAAVADRERRAIKVAAAALDHVAAVPTRQDVVADASDEVIRVRSTVERQVERGVGGRLGRADGVGSSKAVDVQAVEPIGVRDPHKGGQAGDRACVRLAVHVDLVVAGDTVGAVDRHDVEPPVRGAGSGAGLEIGVHLGHAGAGQVAHGEVVAAAPRRDVDLLDAGRVHDRAGAAAQLGPAAGAGEAHALVL
jgi:hypothetical protein